MGVGGCVGVCEETVNDTNLGKLVLELVCVFKGVL